LECIIVGELAKSQKPPLFIITCKGRNLFLQAVERSLPIGRDDILCFQRKLFRLLEDKTVKGISVAPTFAVNEAKNRWLLEKMQALGIREEDIEEKFIRSSGKGGQHVNKTSTCVYLKHLPTGMEVKCMKERSQSVNRFLARRELVEKIEALSGVVSARESKEDKLRKQKAKRKKRAATKYDSTESEIHDKT